MNPADVDASLRAGEPLLDSLDDGFSPPDDAVPQAADTSGSDAGVVPSFGPQSAF
jgi:hypothetical protein